MTKTLATPVRLLLSLVLIALTSACSQQLYGNLSEHEVNDVVGVLRTEGIRASKSPGDGERWSVSVPSAEFARSMAILKNQNLPPQSFDGLGQVFKKDSLVSTETEERARLIYALAQELQRTLSQVDGVVLARVHPVIQPREAFSSKPRVSSAAVFIKHRANVDIESRIPMIRELVAHGIEELDESKVSVATFPAPTRVVPMSTRQEDDLLVWTAAAGGGGTLWVVALLYGLFSLRDRFAEAWVRGRLIMRADGSGSGDQDRQ